MRKNETRAGAGEYYREQQALREAEKEFIRNIRREQKEKEKQEFIKKIASVQDDKTAFTTAELYEAGIAARQDGNGVEAIMHLWQAFVCGDKRAPYPLFEMLHDGEGGIPQNIEMAGMFLLIGRSVSHKRCIGTPNLKDMPFDAAKAIFSVFDKSRAHIAIPGYKITEEIMYEMETAANEALDGFRLKTRAREQPMLGVFQHPVQVELEEKKEVHLASWRRRNRHELRFLMYIISPHFANFKNKNLQQWHFKIMIQVFYVKE